MSVEVLLRALEGVRRTGSGTWIARCPAHKDKHPSLSIAETDAGLVLVHCHAGCPPENIVSAVGMDLSDLFPPEAGTHNHTFPPLTKPYPSADVLECLAEEAQIVALAACNLAHGMTLTECDRERLLVSMHRINEGRRLANGER